MILLEIIKLRLQMPSTAHWFSGLGIAIAYIGVIAFVLGPLAGVGVIIWRLAEWRLDVIRRTRR